MKRQVIFFLLAAISLLCLAGCAGNASDPVLHLGLNAEIVEIDTAKHLLYVADPEGADPSTFGSRRAIDCSRAIQQHQLFYVNYDKEQNVSTINFKDLIAGDQIILGIYDNELNQDPSEAIAAEQIQLGTQRLR